MFEICHQCLLDLLKTHGFEPLHIDNWTINEALYFFHETQFRLSGSSLSESLARIILEKFGLEGQIGQLLVEDCRC